MRLSILKSDPTPCHDSMDCTHNYHQATTILSILSFIVYPRVSIIATRAVLLVGHYLDAEECRVATTGAPLPVGHYLDADKHCTLLSFYGKNISYNKFKGWYFYNKNIERKVDIAVVHVTRNGTFANARPCRKCFSMARDLGIQRIHHTTDLDDELVCGNVKTSSIQDSSAGRLCAR